MRSRLPNILLTLSSAGLWAAGFPVSWVDSWWGIFPLTAFFLSFAAGIFGWGLIAEQRWGGGRAAVWLYSSVAAVGCAMALGHAGLLGAGHRWLFLALLHLGLLAAPWARARALRGNSPTIHCQMLWPS